MVGASKLTHYETLRNDALERGDGDAAQYYDMATEESLKYNAAGC